MASSTIYSEPRLAGPPDRASGNLDATNRVTFEGQLKVRLGHSNVGSVLVPEQLFVRRGKWRFFQTCFFGAPYFRFNIGGGLHDVSFNMDVCGPPLPSGFSPARILPLC
jgi:hypothetical protein